MREVEIILKADEAMRIAAFEHKRVLNYELSQLVAYAVHEPKKMPNYKPMNSKKKEMKTTQADEDRVRSFFIGLASQKGQ